MLTDEEALNELESLIEGCPEEDHSNADKLLCKLLEDAGYKQTVERFRQLTKWYA